jgi:hypothetical protein
MREPAPYCASMTHRRIPAMPRTSLRAHWEPPGDLPSPPPPVEIPPDLPEGIPGEEPPLEEPPGPEEVPPAPPEGEE